MNSFTLPQFIAALIDSARKIPSSVRVTGYVESVNILQELKLRSPVDKGTFRGNWRMNESKSDKSSINFRFSNKTFYAPYMEMGGDLGGDPWNWPNENNPGPVSKSGKLEVLNGRVWAGGKSPAGSVGRTPDGTAPVSGSYGMAGISGPVILYNKKRQIDMASKIADAITGAL